LSAEASGAIKFMAEGNEIIGLTQWLQTPAGRYLLEWEQMHIDAAVADLFGYHALQLGLCEFDALPFDSQSLDLLVLPHALETARDPHMVLREVERVLMPEGRVVVVGFNPASLWGARQWLGTQRRRLARGPQNSLYLPSAGEFIGYRRLRDWLRLLSFEVEAGRFGCYLPPVVSQKWLARFAWMERAGDRWWPVFGAVYFVVAVKRVRGMRLVGLVPQARPVGKAAPAVAVNQTREIEKEPA
jgi:SAM-dependent methyltransferase